MVYISGVSGVTVEDLDAAIDKMSGQNGSESL
jgi:hypothetical protein